MCCVCQEVLNRYNSHFEGEIQGCCPVIADEIAERIGGEVVAGYLCWTTVRRSHWWVVTSDGIVHDPMGDELKDEPGFHRDEAHRQREIFDSILPQFEQWRVA
jgi:hypothetical protein